MFNVVIYNNVYYRLPVSRCSHLLLVFIRQWAWLPSPITIWSTMQILNVQVGMKAWSERLSLVVEDKLAWIVAAAKIFLFVFLSTQNKALLNISEEIPTFLINPDHLRYSSCKSFLCSFLCFVMAQISFARTPAFWVVFVEAGTQDIA